MKWKNRIISSEESNSFPHSQISPNFIEGEKTLNMINRNKPKKKNLRSTWKYHLRFCTGFPMINDQKNATIIIYNYAKETSL